MRYWRLLLRKLVRSPRCHGTVEDHRRVALDVRELLRKRVFEHPTGSTFYLDVRYPWLRSMRVDGASVDLRLATGRTVSVLLAWTPCGFAGERIGLLCPNCHRPRYLLFHLDGKVLCRTCARLWYAAQRVSAPARKFLAMRRIRHKLGAPDYYRDARGQWHASTGIPPKPSRMWRKTYARHLASLARIERSRYLPRRR
jgi:hypothetical protein